jgi:hypothetical protein
MMEEDCPKRFVELSPTVLKVGRQRLPKAEGGPGR